MRRSTVHRPTPTYVFNCVHQPGGTRESTFQDSPKASASDDCRWVGFRSFTAGNAARLGANDNDSRCGLRASAVRESGGNSGRELGRDFRSSFVGYIDTDSGHEPGNAATDDCLLPKQHRS